jgi:hypothetical protein
MKRSLLFILVLPFAAICASFGAVTANAAGFDPGNIIDQRIFTNKNTMDAGAIQNFLNNRVPDCDTNGTQPASDYGRPDLTHAQYAAMRGWSAPPYVCLKNYTENGVSAAQLIYNLAQQYNINPQVLIVTLQKESSLVTDKWPLASQYKAATGYGCPDSGPNNSANCNSNYFGFTNQMTKTAYMFNAIVTRNPNWYSPYVVGNNFIKWSPNSSCGGSNVYIKNWSTAALYDYTPYQPNQSAWNAGWGSSSDPCAAYGNRNFHLYFNAWFGSPTTGTIPWSIESANVFDENKHAAIRLDNSRKNERMYVVLKAKNNSDMTWVNNGSNPIRLGTSDPIDHLSKYCDVLWINCNRAVVPVENSVPPGGTATFEFYIHAPAEGGQYREYFRPVVEHVAWGDDMGWNVYLNSTDTYDWNWNGLSAWTDATKTTPASLDNVAKGQRIYIELKTYNASATVWNKTGANPLRLGTSNPQDGNSVYYDSSWISSNRAAGPIENEVRPGQTATFGFYVTAPQQLGQHRQYFRPVLEYNGWMRDDYNHIYMNVTH